MKVSFSTMFDTLLEVGAGAFEYASGTIPYNPSDVSLVINHGILESKKDFEELAEFCKQARTEEDLRIIVGRLKFPNDNRVNIAGKLGDEQHGY